MKRKAIATLLLGVALWPLSSVQAATDAAAEPRLERIKRTGTLVVAHGEAGVPFSYIDLTGPVGFGVDISKQVAESLRRQLGLNEIKIRWNPVTLTTRFAMVQTSTVDIECISTTNTRERQKLVNFSNTFFVSEEGMAVRKDSGIRDEAGVAGKRVAVVRGTPTEKALTAESAVNGMTVIAERNNRLAMGALVAGRADAYFAAAPIVAGEMVRQKDPSPYQVIVNGGNKEAFGCMLPKDDAAFKKAVDEALAQMMTSGEMERIYNKWFMAPIPPYGRTVGMPLSEGNRRLYAAPNDTAME